MEFAVRVHVALRINCNNCSNFLTFYLAPSLCQNLVHDPGTLWVRWTLSYHFIDSMSLNDTRNGGKKTLYWQLKNKKDKWSISHRIIFSLEGIWCENVFMSQLQEVCRLRFVRHSSTLSKDGWITSWRRREWGGTDLLELDQQTDKRRWRETDRQTDEGRNQRRRWKTWREWIKLE